MGGGTGTADPAVPAGHVPRVDVGDVDATAVAPALALQEQPAGVALGGGEVVGGHPPYRVRREQPAALHGTAGEQHAAEAVPVVGGRDEPAATGRERRHAAPLPGRRVGERQPAGRVGAVVAGEPVAPAGGYREAGVHHAERFEQPLGQELRQRLAGDPRDEHPLDVRAGVVQPRLARLVQHRDARQRGHPLVRRRDLLRLRRSLLQLAEQRPDRGQ